MITGGALPDALRIGSVACASRAQPADSSAASATIFRQHGKFVFRHLRRLGVPEADLDDVMQEVFITVHCSLHRYEERNHLRSWLHHISWRHAARLRRARPPSSACDIETLPETKADPEVAALANEARSELERLLAGLDEHLRRVFVLHEVDELSMTEVVKIVGCPVGTGYSRLRLARKLVYAAARRRHARPQPRSSTAKASRA